MSSFFLLSLPFVLPWSLFSSFTATFRSPTVFPSYISFSTAKMQPTEPQGAPFPFSYAQ